MIKLISALIGCGFLVLFAIMAVAEAGGWQRVKDWLSCLKLAANHDDEQPQNQHKEDST